MGKEIGTYPAIPIFILFESAIRSNSCNNIAVSYVVISNEFVRLIYPLLESSGEIQWQKKLIKQYKK